MSDGTPALRDALQRLAVDASSVSARKVWSALTSQERESALAAALGEEEAAGFRRDLTSEISRVRSFRPQTVQGWNDTQLASVGARLPYKTAGIPWHAILSLHTRDRAELMGCFFDALGIKHTGGQADTASFPAEPFDAPALGAATDAIRARFPLDDVVIFLLCVQIWEPGTFEHASDCVAQLAAETP
jgi:hypothetical protein